MQIVLPGALPDAAIAQELAAHLEEKAPRFTRWLADSQADLIPAAPADTFCTPYEYWLLRHYGFKPDAQQRPAAGLSLLVARDSNAELGAQKPVWLAQLVHVAPARDGAALIPAVELEITPEESAALYESAAPYLVDSGFQVQVFDTRHWLIVPPQAYQPDCASPALVSITSVNDWWTQDTEGRPWRRLVNELQMLWFDHPVNQAREAQGLRPVNSVWLYGGARPEQLPSGMDAPVAPEILRTLQGPALVQDWGSWLLELEKLDRDAFSRIDTTPSLVLTGADSIAELKPARPGFLGKLLGRTQDWRRWWSRRS